MVTNQRELLDRIADHRHDGTSVMESTTAINSKWADLAGQNIFRHRKKMSICLTRKGKSKRFLLKTIYKFH